MRLDRKSIIAKGMAKLELYPNGIKWSDLVRFVSKDASENTENEIKGALQKLVSDESLGVIKISRGTYRLSKFRDAEDKSIDMLEEIDSSSSEEAQNSEKLLERQFYQSFSDWLIDNDEATHAVALGGKALGGKWGTPDVIGVLRPLAGDIFKFVPQIVTAEIKADPNQPVVAFGQAVAYRLFSHKTYIVVPKTTSDEDINKLKSLCGIHGVGLVVFDLDEKNPNYNVMVLPETAEPDVFYVNNILGRLKPDVKNKLF